jgi:hypothetical protein
MQSLTALGFTDYILQQDGRVLSPEEGEEIIQRARESLLNSHEEFEKLCEWLKQIEKSDTIIKKANSESLARYAEKEIGCLCQQVAAGSLGLGMVCCNSSTQQRADTSLDRFHRLHKFATRELTILHLMPEVKVLGGLLDQLPSNVF